MNSSYFTEFFINVIQNGGYFAITILMIFDSFNFPIPSEIVIPFGSYLASINYLNIYLVVLCSVIGSVVGSLLSYFLAEFILEARKKLKILKKLLPEKSINKTHFWFEKYGSFSVFWGRMVPGVRTFISLPAGIAKMSLPKFISYTFLGSIIWSSFLAYLGFNLKNSWEIIYFYLKKLEIVFITIILALIFIFIIKNLFRKRV